MFATAVRLLARKSAGPKPVKLSELGDGVQPAMDNLFNILKEHGPLTVQDCWKHASQLENAGFRSKRHMKLILRWMRENRRVRKECNSIGEHPDEKQFVFSIWLNSNQATLSSAGSPQPLSPTVDENSDKSAASYDFWVTLFNTEVDML
ncbi:unnamed protein product [Sphagnum jensenii]|uniref:Uncharacterized protein n=1 Tax=Sphagnum jensenii TaxID=128206 RepID=A0ABP0VS55_9BRYO